MSKVIVLDHYRDKPEPPVARSLLLEICVYANGDETLWVGDELQTAEQFNWAIAQVSECLAALLDVKGERAGTR